MINMILVDWNILLHNKTAEEMILCFTETLLKIIETYVPHYSVTVNDKDAPWVTPGNKRAIKRNKHVFHKCKKGGRKPDEKAHVNKVQRETKAF